MAPQAQVQALAQAQVQRSVQAQVVALVEVGSPAQGECHAQ